VAASVLPFSRRLCGLFQNGLMLSYIRFGGLVGTLCSPLRCSRQHWRCPSNFPPEQRSRLEKVATSIFRNTPYRRPRPFFMPLTTVRIPFDSLFVTRSRICFDTNLGYMQMALVFGLIRPTRARPPLTLLYLRLPQVSVWSRMKPSRPLAPLETDLSYLRGLPLPQPSFGYLLATFRRQHQTVRRWGVSPV